MKRPTIVIRKQISGKYMLQVYENGVMVKEERDFDDPKEASKRAEEIKGESDATQQGTGSE